jgi:hypothetical protein
MGKNVILWDLGSKEVEQDELHRFQNGKGRAGVALYTRQCNKLVNQCQMKIGNGGGRNRLS